MSENKKEEEFKKSFINYLDILLSIMNTLIILFSLIIFGKNLLISILGVILTLSLALLTFYTFIKNNPLYIYYCYVLLICGVLFLIPSTMINPFLGILFFPQLCFIYNISKGKSQSSALSTYAKAKYLKRMGVHYGLNAQKLSQQWDNINPELELKKNQQRDLLEKRYNSKKVLISSLCLFLSLIIVFAFFTISIVSI
ncbi:MAG: hypothetical protein ACFFEY_10610 [Candidatus Thorarchaeota archaeon]